nr:E3 SUMO-protein ligase ZBED1-like [Drosophila bipectinata]
MHGSSRKSSLDKALISMIATDLQPFRIVEDGGFRNFVYCLDPQYTLPSRRTLNDVLLSNMYDDMTKKLKDILSKVRHCAVTTDGWTSRANDHYLTVTCYFFMDDFEIKSAVLSTSKLLNDLDQTSENIAISLHKVFSEWGVASNISAIVTDNASSMIKACSILGKRHMPCFAHTLNLIMQDTLQLEKIKPIIAKCKRIVAFFKSSSNAYAKLKSVQESHTSYGLTQEVPTRWNSCYKMVSRILKIKDSIFRVLLDTKKDPPPLTAEEVSVLYDLELLFEPFDTATNRVSGSSYICDNIANNTVIG